MLTIFTDIILGLISGPIYAIALLVSKQQSRRQLSTIKSSVFNAVRFFISAVGIVFFLRSIVTFPMLYMTCFFSGYWIIIYRYGISPHES